MSREIYLDYAATSAIRPDEVVEAMVRYLREVGATPGRAGHRRALEAGRVALRCRRALARLFHIPGDPGRVTLQPNATYALNAALVGTLRPGDAVVRTAYDHNSIRRPVAALVARGVEERVVAGRPDGGVDLDEVRGLLRSPRPARLLVIPHASNVLGSVLPVAEMAALAHEAGARVLLDAAQTAGHIEVDVEALGVDLLAFAGHKGLLGPQGTGGLWVREGVEVEPVAWGGTGGDSSSPTMPAAYPDRLEAGTLNGPGIAGLLAGLGCIEREGLGTIAARERSLKALLLERLAAVPAVEILSPPAPGGVAIVTLTSRRWPAHELALRLEREFGVLVRAGLHCAPEAHMVLGTLEHGAVRLSAGWATTEDDVHAAADALARLHQP